MMLEKAKNPAFWETVRTSPAYGSLREELLTFWEENCTEPLTAEKYSLFISYSLTGSPRRTAAFVLLCRGLCYPDGSLHADGRTASDGAVHLPQTGGDPGRTRRHRTADADCLRRCRNCNSRRTGTDLHRLHPRPRRPGIHTGNPDWLTKKNRIRRCGFFG